MNSPTLRPIIQDSIKDIKGFSVLQSKILFLNILYFVQRHFLFFNSYPAYVENMVSC